MKTLLILTIAIIVTSTNLQSEEQNIYNEDGTVNRAAIENMHPLHIAEIYDNDSEEYDLLKTGMTHYSVAQVFSTAGGFAVGWPIGSYLGGGEPNWDLAYGGLSAIGIGLVFAFIAQDYVNDSIDLFISKNNGALSRLYIPNGQVLTVTNIGLSIRF